MTFIADTHTHTMTSTHAYSTLTENVVAAAERGMRCIAMTDHYGTIPDAPHPWHFYNLTILPRTLHGVHILRGAEVNIVDKDGTIDLTDDYLLPRLEWIVASIHTPCYQPKSREDCTTAYAGVAMNPFVDCIGHSDGEDYDHESVFRILRDQGKLLELNNSRLIKDPRSSGRYLKMMKLARRMDVRIIVNSDAHFHNAVGEFTLAKALLEEAEFPQELVLNADWERFRAYVEAKHPGVLPE